MVFGFGPLEIGGVAGGLVFGGGAAKKRAWLYKHIILPAYRRGESICCHVDYQTLLIRDAEEELETARSAAEEAAAALAKARANKEEIDAAAAGTSNSWVSSIINSCRGAPGDLSLAQANAARIVEKLEKAEKAAADLVIRRGNTVRQLKAGEEVTTTFTPSREENAPPPQQMIRDGIVEEEEKEDEVDPGGIQIGPLNTQLIVSPQNNAQQTKIEFNILLNQAQETLLAATKWQAQVKAYLKEVNKRLKELKEQVNDGNSEEHAANLAKLIKAEELRIKLKTPKANILKDRTNKAEETAQATKDATEAILVQLAVNNAITEETMLQIRELAAASTEADKLARTAASELQQFIIGEYLKSSSSHHKIQEFFVKKAVLMLQEEFSSSEDPQVVEALQHLVDIMKVREDLNIARSLRVILEKSFANTAAGKIQAEIRKVTAKIDKSQGSQETLETLQKSKAELETQFVKAIAVKPSNAAVNLANILEQITAILKRKPSEDLSKELRERELLRNQEDLNKAKTLLADISDAQLHLEIANKAGVIDGIIAQLKSQEPIKNYFAILVKIRNLMTIQKFKEELEEETVNNAAITKLEEIRQNINLGHDVKKHMQALAEMKKGHGIIIKAQALIKKFESESSHKAMVDSLKTIQNGLRTGEKNAADSSIGLKVITDQLKAKADQHEEERVAALEQQEGLTFPVINTVMGWLPRGVPLFGGNNNVEVHCLTDIIYNDPELVAGLLTGKTPLGTLEDVVHDETLKTDEDFTRAITAINFGKFLSNNQVVQEENIQDIIDIFKQVVGEDVYSESTGFHKYISTKSSHSLITKLVQSLDTFSKMKDFFEAAGNFASQSEDYNYLVEAISRAATIFQIGMNDRLDTIANGPMSVTAPKHPHFVPDDDFNGGSGGGGSYFEEGGEPSVDNNENIIPMLLGELTHANSYYEDHANSSDTSSHNNEEVITLVLGNAADNSY